MGYARSALSNSDLRSGTIPQGNSLTHSLTLDLFPSLLQAKPEEKDKVDSFFASNSYVKGSYDKKEDFDNLNAEMLKLEQGSSAGNRLVYLALPPSVFATVTTNIKACCMSKT